MRAAQLGRFRRGLVELAPIYEHNVRYAERSIRYAAEHGLMAFRLSSDVLPLLDQDPELRRLVPSLAPLRRLVRETGVHVSNHPAQFVVLSSPSEAVVANASGFLRDTAWLMDRIGAEGSITIQGGGVYGDRASAGARLRANIAALPRSIREHLALENDEKCWTVPELIEATSGAVPIVFDKLHWEANPRSAPYATELEAALATWPADRLPELHYSEQAPGRPRGAHGDHVTGRGLLRFLEEIADVAGERDAVVIVEAKQKDLAILRAVGELDGRRRARLLELVPALKGSRDRGAEGSRGGAAARAEG